MSATSRPAVTYVAETMRMAGKDEKFETKVMRCIYGVRRVGEDCRRTSNSADYYRGKYNEMENVVVRPFTQAER